MATVGSRAKVMHGEADRTPGGLTAKDLKYSADGRIISKKQSEAAKANPGLKMWRDSVAEAKKKLKIKDDKFVPVTGKLLDKAHKIHKKMKKSAA